MILQGEDAEVQFTDQTMGCIAGNITHSHEEHSLKQCVIKAENNKQFVAQVQPILHQPIQIHQQIQAVDVVSLIASY